MKKNLTENDTVYFHEWTSETPIKANVFSTVVFEDGGQEHCEIGKIDILKGDALYLTYGANRQVYTRSGRAYESEYPHGRITLHGCPIGITLTLDEAQNVKQTSAKKSEFEAKILEQQKRVEPLINSLAETYVEKENIKRKERAEAQVIAKEKRQKMILDALKQMDEFFGNKKEDTSQQTTPKKLKPR